VLFAARYLDELGALAGDVGARALLERHAADVGRVPVADDGVLVDVDTPETLAALDAPGE
jgi:molybdenum cofactor cytidylyltransferase